MLEQVIVGTAAQINTKKVIIVRHLATVAMFMQGQAIVLSVGISHLKMLERI